jgi:glycosyltransferase involved in cell wall biosynthesis
VWIMYAGGIGDVQGLETAVRALGLLTTRPDIKLALVGDGVALDALLALATTMGVRDRVRYLGSRPMLEMPSLMAEADAQLISLRDLPVFHGTVPSKTQSTMATGLPIVCSAPGDAAWVVDQARAGFTAPPEDPARLAEAFLAVARLTEQQKDEMGAAGRQFYEAQLSEDIGAAKFDRLLTRAAAARRSR